MPFLYVLRGKEYGKHWSIPDAGGTIGRGEENDLVLTDTEVSRNHARIRPREQGWILEDLRSSNGSFVNGQRCDQRKLDHGDRIQLGQTLLIFTTSARLSPAHHSTFSDDRQIRITSESAAAELSQIRSSLAPFDPAPRPVGLDPANPHPSASAQRTTRAAGNPWEVMYHTAIAVSRTIDIDKLLEQILGLIFDSIECDRGCIMLTESDHRTLRPACRRDRVEGSRSGPLEISRTILDHVMEHQEGVLTSNANTDSRWESSASIQRIGIREAICVPMQGRYGTVGVLYIDTSISPGDYIAEPAANRFTEEHLRMMIAIGHQAALAIEDTAYYRGMLQAERLAAMGQTIATISHHVKNILQGIRGGCYLVEEARKKKDWQLLDRGWSIVDRNQDRIANLVLDMLTLTKDRQPQWRMADPRLTIAEVVDLIQLRAGQASVELLWSPPDPFPLVACDPESLHQAILNLLLNAIDACSAPGGDLEPATPAKRSVRIELHLLPADASQQIAIDVSDNGPGIPSEQQAKLFSLFESSKGARGTGLGLAACRKILREHGGDAQLLESSPSGTRFRLHWPLRDRSALPNYDAPPLPTRFSG
jgi:signal transduction histidine kinase